MKLPPAFNLDQAAAIPPGKMRLGDACSLVEDLLEDMRREMIQKMDRAGVDEAVLAEVVAHVDVATERARIDVADQLLTLTDRKN